MAMIQGIDGNALLQAFRAGRDDRYEVDQRALATRKAEREMARQDQVQGLIGQLFGGSQPSGVQTQFQAPSGLVATPGQQAQTSNLEAQFPNAPKVAPEAAPAPALNPSHARRGPDPNVLAKLIAIDPETGSKLATAFKSMNEMDLQQHQTKNDMLGAAAHWLSQYPLDQRGQMMHILEPQLAAAGWSPDELAHADLSDNGLKGYQAVAVDFDKMIDNELAERKFQAGDNVPVQAGGNVVNVKPNGSARYVVGGPGAQSSGIPQGAQDYLKQHPELRDHFDEKYGPGAADSILGGGASNGTGNFPPRQ